MVGSGVRQIESSSNEQGNAIHGGTSRSKDVLIKLPKPKPGQSSRKPSVPGWRPEALSTLFGPPALCGQSGPQRQISSARAAPSLSTAERPGGASQRRFCGQPLIECRKALRSSELRRTGIWGRYGTDSETKRFRWPQAAGLSCRLFRLTPQIVGRPPALRFRGGSA